MQALEPKVNGYIEQFLIPPEDIWQPTDFLPESEKDDDTFFEQVRQIREEAKELPYDFWVVLVGDMITEEALPTYESWLLDVEGIDQHSNTSWSKWIHHWTGEENRHGDLLNKYLYLSGRVNMREVEISTQHLLNEGFDNLSGRDPYRNFIYTSFQELATNISHKRVGEIASKINNKLLGKMCKMIAGDEMRHHIAYRTFVKDIFEIDPSEMMLAFADMMKKKIAMPSQCVRESGGEVGETYVHFSNSAQRMGVYTAMDYVDILSKLLKNWKIDGITNLTDEANKARDYLMALPGRLTRIVSRMKTPEHQHIFKWVEPNGMMV